MVYGASRMVVRETCRACNSTRLFPAIDLGLQPIAGAFTKDTEPSYLYPNRMLMCEDCGLGQLSHDLSPSELYKNYNWRTSTSKSYIEYIHDFADKHVLPTIKSGDWVLEIASNDGYLLKYLQQKGIDVLGVDPAENISMYAICDGVPVITDFFSVELANEIVRLKGKPKWIIANNVLAHTPNIQSFMAGISALCGSDTTVTIENPTVMNILDHDHFDVIFHEHYSYLSAYSVAKLANKFGLSLFNVQSTPPQGGSNRYWIKQGGEPLEGVRTAIREEIEYGLIDRIKWEETQERILDKANKFKGKVESLWQSGAVICGVGASAKSTVMLNFAGISTKRISAIADDVKEKQGYNIPGINIPIVSMDEMLKLDPTDIIVFAWNIKDELENKLRNLGYTGNVWVWNGE
jgi:2-polyprenyl-3-methyl-5-hydroxy-6-metoxy-1,4-benzoquinol methylase